MLNHISMFSNCVLVYLCVFYCWAKFGSFVYLSIFGFNIAVTFKSPSHAQSFDVSGYHQACQSFFPKRHKNMTSLTYVLMLSVRLGFSDKSHIEMFLFLYVLPQHSLSMHLVGLYYLVDCTAMYVLRIIFAFICFFGLHCTVTFCLVLSIVCMFSYFVLLVHILTMLLTIIKPGKLCFTNPTRIRFFSCVFSHVNFHVGSLWKR